MPNAYGVASSAQCLEHAQAPTRVVENAVLTQRGARFGRYFLTVVMTLLGTLSLVAKLQHGIRLRFDTLAGLVFFSCAWRSVSSTLNTSSRSIARPTEGLMSIRGASSSLFVQARFAHVNHENRP